MTRWKGGAAALLAALLSVAAWAVPKLPVVTVEYDGAVGSVETEEETIEDSSYRHEVGLRMREQWTRDLVSTLNGDVTRKILVSGSGSSYTALQLSPAVRWTVTDRLKWDATMVVRRTLYDELDSDDLSRSFTRLKADTGLGMALAKGVVLVPRVQATLELYDNPLKSRQSYGVGLGLDARIGQWSLGADYRGSLRLGLGPMSLTSERLDHTFGAGVTWDPNR